MALPSKARNSAKVRRAHPIGSFAVASWMLFTSHARRPKEYAVRYLVYRLHQLIYAQNRLSLDAEPKRATGHCTIAAVRRDNCTEETSQAFTSSALLHRPALSSPIRDPHKLQVTGLKECAPLCDNGEGVRELFIELSDRYIWGGCLVVE
ncbi:uncharacterized protein MYCFIDRAFT_211480 [Pseudocercospora fijiensis CIRAD86]|uniref:Uncharacterized protein n=1 Tax=Pseudocercospora fijiensis (strain CIRAD86) TaxID=383855 RepID=M3AXN1_PSEFD|nr:uncharacterized protein MYCFIDRAFT_211480 [Pseudocercospora fijiensis CIRAD86]EME81863.1 hypothetical protein MYCFIDRAFT_211480 [Pseudocercospora fijiensis CIRAD86]